MSVFIEDYVSLYHNFKNVLPEIFLRSLSDRKALGLHKTKLRQTHEIVSLTIWHSKQVNLIIWHFLVYMNKWKISISLKMTCTYRKCPHTSHCIRREFFCDGRINCAWPNAEEGGTDEVNCDAEGKTNFNFMT